MSDRHHILLRVVVIGVFLCAFRPSSAFAQQDLISADYQATFYADRGARAAMEFEYLEACKWFALATAIGGTRFQDRLVGVQNLLSENERTECIELARTWRPAPPRPLTAEEISALEKRDECRKKADQKCQSGGETDKAVCKFLAEQECYDQQNQ